MTSVFGSYLINLLSRIFRRDPEIQKWVDSFGASLDEAKASIFAMRRAWFIQTASGYALDEHGKGRRLLRYPGESDEAYKMRLLAAYQIYAEGGTVPGIKHALERLGYPDAIVYELFKEQTRYIELGGKLLDGAWSLDGARLLDAPPDVRQEWLGRWAEFALDLNIGDDRGFLRSDYEALLDTINRAKRATSKLAEIIFRKSGEGYIPLRFEWGHRARYFFIEGHGVHLYRQVLLDGGTPQATVLYKVLDGAWLLGGATKLNGILSVTGWRLDQELARGEGSLKVSGLGAIGGYHPDGWLLDGGGPRYRLDGRWPLISNMLDGYSTLDGSWRLTARTLGDTAIRLDGSHRLGGRISDRLGLEAKATVWRRGECEVIVQ